MASRGNLSEEFAFDQILQLREHVLHEALDGVRHGDDSLLLRTRVAAS